ncbi:MAG: hypothetical protein O6940_11415 [Ignavibacteria bacterium]|nr:hypothetical protein [Ignavibacteria bacterium]
MHNEKIIQVWLFPGEINRVTTTEIYTHAIEGEVDNVVKEALD